MVARKPRLDEILQIFNPMYSFYFCYPLVNSSDRYVVGFKSELDGNDFSLNYNESEFVLAMNRLSQNGKEDTKIFSFLEKVDYEARFFTSYE